MADNTVNKLEYLIKDLETTSVTLSPTTATVVRQINNVRLVPGPNEITVYGLTPTIEEHSLQIEGQGSASIADMTIESVTNNDQFDFSSDSDSDSDDDDESDDDIFKADKAEKDLIAKKDSLGIEITDAQEELQALKYKLDLLDRYGRSFTAKDSGSDKVVSYLRTYSENRDEMYQSHKVCTAKVADLTKQVEEVAKQISKLEARRRKEAEKAKRKKRKEAAKKAQIKADKAKVRRLAKEEKRNFWPLKVFKLVFLLEVPTGSSLSRRSSIDNTKAVASSKSGSTGDEVSLSFSYVSNDACWWPAYDLKIVTPTQSGTLAYRAEFKNNTSETWRNAKIALTTSQTAFSGLTSTVPTLLPWHIRLGKRMGHTNKSFSSNAKSLSSSPSLWQGGLESQREIDAKRQNQYAHAKPKREALFASSNVGWQQNNNTNTNAYGGPSSNQSNYRSVQPYERAHEKRRKASFGGAPGARGGGVFGSAAPAAAAAPRAQQSTFTDYTVDAYERSEELEGTAPDDASIASDDTVTRALDYQESSREDYGLTTTYTVPTNRTLVPSKLTRRHNLADINLSSITLSYIVIPKLREAAFLKARIRNTSPTTLLRGRANLTLDGTFLGTSTIPRASPDETFVLPLGVDPAIHVSYAKPTVRRNTTGGGLPMFSTKEENIIYTRVIGLTNKKSTKVELLVLDQVPVSEDEGLKMMVLEPRGLRGEGDRNSKAGMPTTTKGGEWGSAVATLKKDGQVAWDVKLNAGHGCKLVLEYVSKFPASDQIVGID